MNHRLLEQVHAEHTRALKLVEDLDDSAWRQQYHPDLSPLGWHIGHLLFIETYWLREVVLGDNRLTDSLKPLYFPWLSPKPQRARRLPDKDKLGLQAQALHKENLEWLAELLLKGSGHALLRDNYLLHFLIQHYCQHIETMHQVLLLRALQTPGGGALVNRPLSSRPPVQPELQFDTAPTHIGNTDHAAAYDNELPRHEVVLRQYRLAAVPVSNAEYLGFIEANGYTTRKYWCETGWRWVRGQGITAPLHWRRDHKGDWGDGASANGAADLDPAAAVYGISHHEATAFARYAQCRLPTEAEWEHAMNCRPGLFDSTGQAWEWCGNAFYPYPGFRAFPYDGYSKPWFDGAHFCLRGGSRFTSPQIRRPSFRNFYTADKRHIFAGLRLAL